MIYSRWCRHGIQGETTVTPLLCARCDADAIRMHRVVNGDLDASSDLGHRGQVWRTNPPIMAIRSFSVRQRESLHRRTDTDLQWTGRTIITSISQLVRAKNGAVTRRAGKASPSAGIGSKIWQWDEGDHAWQYLSLRSRRCQRWHRNSPNQQRPETSISCLLRVS